MSYKYYFFLKYFYKHWLDAWDQGVILYDIVIFGLVIPNKVL